MKYSPPISSQRRDGRDINKCREASFEGAAGREARARQREALIVVRPAKLCIRAELTTPSARKKVASRHLIGRAATPPLRGGECWSMPLLADKFMYPSHVQVLTHNRCKPIVFLILGAPGCDGTPVQFPAFRNCSQKPHSEIGALKEAVKIGASNAPN